MFNFLKRSKNKYMGMFQGVKIYEHNKYAVCYECVGVVYDGKTLATLLAVNPVTFDHGKLIDITEKEN